MKLKYPPSWQTIRTINIVTGAGCAALAITQGPSWTGMMLTAFASASIITAFHVTHFMSMRKSFDELGHLFDQTKNLTMSKGRFVVVNSDKSNLRGVIIDPERRSVEVVETDGSPEQTQALVRASALDHFRLADHGESWDYGWVDDDGLTRGQPVHAFKIDIRDDPIAGRCLLIGVKKETGDTTDAHMPVDFLREHIDWLGEIVPEVTWDETESGSRAIVTYARVKS